MALNPAHEVAWGAKSAEEDLLDAVVTNYVDTEDNLTRVEQIAQIDPELGEALKRYIAKLHLLRAFVDGLRGAGLNS